MHNDYLTEFNRLRDRKREADSRLDVLKGLIKRLMESFPDGIPAGTRDSLPSFLQGFSGNTPGGLAAVIEHPQIWSIICDQNDIMLGASQGTFFEGIRKLPPGHTLTFAGGRASIRPYWSVDPGTEPGEDLGEDAYREGLLDLLQDSVRRQMISDVPLGATLSGGLDSGTIVALMSRVSERPVITFTIGFGGHKDELDHARRVADHCRTEHREFIVDPSHFTETLPRVLWHLEEPILSSIMPTWYLGEAARKLVTVVLIGEGSDEIFAGYRRLWPVAERYRRFVPARAKQWFYFWHFSSFGSDRDDPLWSPASRAALSPVDPVTRYYRPAMRLFPR